MYNNRRSCIIKVLIILCLIYFAIHIITNSGLPVIRELQQSGRSLAALDNQALDQSQQEPLVDQSQVVIENGKLNSGSILQPMPNTTKSLEVVTVQKKQEVVVSEVITTTQRQPTVLEKVKEITKCLDKPMIGKTQQRGDYWVLYNYITAEKRFRCEETITYTTHADYSFMDNLVPLLERWRAPISIALHAPGSDFPATLESIAHLRDCTSPLVRELVTFHIYFSTKHVPKEVPKHNHVFTEPYNCSLTPPYLNVSSDQMYKAQKKLLYPVNVGRNVAREMAQTYYILASDIELYPSPNITTKFLEMIATNTGTLLSKHPKVFPLTIFEVSANSTIPENKTILKEMLGSGKAFPFHKKLCPVCHGVPKAKEWQAAPETEGLHVFHVGKRSGKFVHWEPIYIGTHVDPLYDERLSWEGMSDKMTQGYALCVLDYDFLILDNAFLVHKPGIKVYKKDQKRAVLAAKTHQLIKKIIFPELRVLYGIKKGCAV